jgi:negative regulator of sigma-B (phosphoserine phosphatase)
MSVNVDVAVYQKSKDGNYYCGDTYFYEQSENEFICAIADGLGSGEYAKESSQIVIDIIRENRRAAVDDLVKISNEQLLGKRGVVIGILKVNFAEKTYTYSSIGNIGIMLVKEGKKKMRNIPSSGYLAGYKRPFKVIEGELEPNMNFIMFSDGIEDRELSEPYFLKRNVQDVISVYKQRESEIAKDDKTLIAIGYKEA